MNLLWTRVNWRKFNVSSRKSSWCISQEKLSHMAVTKNFKLLGAENNGSPSTCSSCVNWVPLIIHHFLTQAVGAPIVCDIAWDHGRRQKSPWMSHFKSAQCKVTHAFAHGSLTKTGQMASPSHLQNAVLPCVWKWRQRKYLANSTNDPQSL